MTKYHLNPQTGNPGKCSAEQGNCPFGDPLEHYDFPAEARKSFESIVEAEAKRGALVELADELVKTSLARHLALVARRQVKKNEPGWEELHQPRSILYSL